MNGPDARAQIAGELYTALERLGADPEFLCTIGSWRDTLDDADVLPMQRDYNTGRPILHWHLAQAGDLEPARRSMFRHGNRGDAAALPWGRRHTHRLLCPGPAAIPSRIRLACGLGQQRGGHDSKCLVPSIAAPSAVVRGRTLPPP
jgi:hypothetical protein